MSFLGHFPVVMISTRLPLGAHDLDSSPAWGARALQCHQSQATACRGIPPLTLGHKSCSGTQEAHEWHQLVLQQHARVAFLPRTSRRRRRLVRGQPVSSLLPWLPARVLSLGAAALGSFQGGALRCANPGRGCADGLGRDGLPLVQGVLMCTATPRASLPPDLPRSFRT